MTTSSSTCPPDDTLALFAEGALPPAQTEALAAHSEGCEACRRVVAALARLRSSRDAADLPEVAAGPSLRAGAQVGRYVVQRPVGAGAMGIVFEAFDPALERRVALKLLKGASEPAAQARLQREGQVMAKLSHRNVATVHDVGEVQGSSWVAMEFIDGLTLRQWLKAAPRSPEVILRVLLDAGAGLAAAHREGLVHRDFKPDNVLVEAGGRVVVTDFGLASAPDAPPAPGAATGRALQTHEGALVGTPAYMALEQLEGKAADARSDQFAFCVTCVEAFAGQRPFDGKDLRALEERLRVAVPEDAVWSKVPARLRPVLLRGLSASPERRFEAMEPLLTALAPPPAGRKPVLAVVAAAAAVALASGGYVFNRARVCSGADEKLGEGWNAQTREAVRAAFLATKLPFAGAAAAGLDASLDVWAREWTHSWTEACEDTRVRGAASEELLDLKMSCLSERLAEVKSLAGLLAQADADAVKASSGAVQRLSPISSCADEKALRAPVRPPADAQSAAKVAELRAELARAVALRAAGRYRDAKAVSEPLVAAAGTLRFRPLEADALLLQGQLQEDLDDFDGASATLSAAAVAAQAGGHLLASGQAWAFLTRIDGEKRAKYAEGHAAAALAGAVLERLGSPPELAALLARNLGDVLSEEGKHADAKAQYEVALALQRQEDPGSVQVAASLNALGVEVRKLGDVKASLALQEEALALITARLGPTHPDVAMVQKNIGNFYWSQSQLDEALSWYQKALALQLAAFGEDSLEVASTRNNVASVYIRQQKHDEAEAALRSVLEVMSAKLGPNHPRLYGQLNNLAVVLRYKQQHAEAKAILLRALAVAEAAHGPVHGDVATTLINLGDAQLAAREFDDSVKSYERAVAITLETLGPAHPDLAECYGGLAFPLLQLKQYARALEATEKSLGILSKGEGNPLVEAQVRFAHAQAAWEVKPAARAAAVAEVQQARQTLLTAGAQASDLVEVDAWLTAHRLKG